LLDGVAWTDDRGRNADRIASIDTLELHQAIVDWCLAALRNGAGVELIDALRFWHLSDVRVSVVDEDERKQRLLVSEIDDTTRSYEQARRNANRTTDPDLVDDFPADAALLRGKLRQLEKQLDELGSDTALPTLEQFTSDASFIAHGIAALAHCGADAPAELAAQLSEVLEFTNVALDQVARTVTFTFRLLLPADGKVAYFGPITATVANRAYPGTLKGLPRLEEARTLLCDQSADSPHRATRQLAARLVEIGWSPLAASTLARSGVEPLYRIALQLLGDNQPLDDLDPELVQHVLATYADPKFTWNPRYHHVDCTTRQRLIDLVLAAGGQVTHEDLLNQLDGSGVQPADVTIMSLPQTFGTAPTWPPSILRIGDWGRRSPRSTRSLLVVECPHCDGWASTAVRTPEVPTGRSQAACAWLRPGDGNDQRRRALRTRDRRPGPRLAPVCVARQRGRFRRASAPKSGNAIGDAGRDAPADDVLDGRGGTPGQAMFTDGSRWRSQSLRWPTMTVIALRCSGCSAFQLWREDEVSDAA
jgi:hypothetical protein